MFNVLTVTEGWEGAGGEVFEKLRPATQNCKLLRILVFLRQKRT